MSVSTFFVGVSVLSLPFTALTKLVCRYGRIARSDKQLVVKVLLVPTSAYAAMRANRHVSRLPLR